MDQKISAIIATYNEDKRLEECLLGLQFCKEILVVDLGSSDDSARIARKYATKVIEHERVYQVEALHAKFVPKLKNDFVLITDPDEVMMDGLADEVLELINNNSGFTQINVPIRYYYKGRLLKGTIWGHKQNVRKLIINRTKVNFFPKIHRGVSYKESNPKIINIKTDLYIKHYWADSFKDLLEKHKRYLKFEGQSRYDNGERYSLYKKIKESFRAITKGLIKYRGILYGPIEVFLCFFYGWYVWQANNSLKQYERENE